MSGERGGAAAVLPSVQGDSGNRRRMNIYAGLHSPEKEAAMNTDVMFSSRSELWETPKAFFDELDKEFHFTLDVCALPENAKCRQFYTPDQDGLTQPWKGTCWCNPPYGRKIEEWVSRAAEAAKNGAVVVMLLPSRTDTAWFHKYLYKKPGVELRFIKGRLRFGDSRNSAPFPSLVAVLRGADEV